MVRASMASQKEPKEISQNFRQTINSNPMQETEQIKTENKQEIERVEEIKTQPVKQETKAMPNFSEEITSLQSSATNENMAAQEKNESTELSLNQVPSPIELKIEESQTNPLKLEVPPTPTLGQNNSQISNVAKFQESDQKQTTIRNTPNIVEL